MARQDEGILKEVWAIDAPASGKVPPDFAETDGWGELYQTAIDSGGKPVLRTTFNYTFNQLYSLGVDINKMGGALEWAVSLTYVLGGTVFGSDGLLYACILENIGFDPTGGANPSKWTAITRYQELSKEIAGSEGSKLVGHTNESVYDKLVSLQNTIDTLTPFAAYVRTTSHGTVGGPDPVISVNKNIASVIRAGHGNYLVTFAVPMSHSGYLVLSSRSEGQYAAFINTQNFSESQCEVYGYDWTSDPVASEFSLAVIV